MIKKISHNIIVMLILAATLVSQEPTIHDTIHSPTNSYTIQELLGEGAFGKVFAVVDTSGKPFAMKWYKDHSGKEGFFKLYAEGQREFEIGQTLSHPNIIATHEFFSDQDDESHFLILELVDGKTVYKTPKKSLSTQDANRLASQLTDAMHYAYSLGFIHLDLHSGNIMLSTNSKLKVIDLASFFSWDELSEFFKENNAKGLGVKIMDERIDQKFTPKRAHILKQFLKGNPEIFEKFEEEMHEKALPLIKDNIKKYWASYWFNWVTDANVNILLKSKMKPEERINLRGNIKRISWEYEEADSERIKFIPLTPYFERLENLLNFS